MATRANESGLASYNPNSRPECNAHSAIPSVMYVLELRLLKKHMRSNTYFEPNTIRKQLQTIMRFDYQQNAILEKFDLYTLILKHFKNKTND